MQKNEYDCVPVKFYLQKQAEGGFGLWARVCWLWF